MMYLQLPYKHTRCKAVTHDQTLRLGWLVVHVPRSTTFRG